MQERDPRGPVLFCILTVVKTLMQNLTAEASCLCPPAPDPTFGPHRDRRDRLLLESLRRLITLACANSLRSDSAPLA